GGGLRGAGSPGGLPKRAADADDREVPHRGQARDPAAVPRGSLTIPVQGPSTTPVVPGGSPIAMILCTCMMPAFAYRNTQFSVLGVVTANRSYTGDGIFWSVLTALVEHEAVTFDTWRGDSKGKPVIGKPVMTPPSADLVCISTDLALAEVNKCLRAQGKPELKVTTATLLGQLRREGRLLVSFRHVCKT